MTDRELLEAAARAAGYTYFHDGYDNYMHYPCIEVDGFPVKWEPLTDDGDRYRLLEALKMAIDFEAKEVIYCIKDVLYSEPFREDGDDARAVLRAAAEIGRARK